jgi:hypothetical protein
VVILETKVVRLSPKLRLFPNFPQKWCACFHISPKVVLLEVISPTLQEAVQTVHTHQLAECAWRWIRRLVTAPLCNHPKRRQICFPQNQGINPTLQQALQPVHALHLA